MLLGRRSALVFGLSTLAASTQTQAEPVEQNQNIAPDATSRRNAEIIRRHHAVMNTGDVAAAAQFYAEDARNHGRPVGRQGVLLVLADIYATFPDWRMEIEDLDAIGDDVVVRMTVTGTHKGVGKRAVNGGLLVDVPPTGKSFKVQHIHWYTLKGGLIVEHQANRDDIGMMTQLGLLPAVK